MMRARIIKPGIAYNEDLGKLGPVAEVIFTRLWMLADRDGRLEYRPEKIKNEALANYPCITVEIIADVVDNLCKTGMTERYSVAPERGKSANTYIAIVNFAKHQWIHPREAKSVLPSPPASKQKHRSKSVTIPGTDKDVQGTTGKSLKRRSVIGNRYTVISNGEDARTREGSEIPTEEPPPSGPNPEKPKRKPPAHQTNGLPSEAPPARKAVTDFWPHSKDDVDTVRASLNELASLVHLPAPDDQIIRKVLDVANGASGTRIHAVLRELWLDHKFRNMRSWGLIPVVLAPWFQTANAARAG